MSAESQSTLIRERLAVRGRVQGVGFRPWVYRLALRHRVTGCVRNEDQGATVEVEGREADVAAFRSALLRNPPPQARVTDVQVATLPPDGAGEFVIADSRHAPDALVGEIPPDLATCPDCLRELQRPSDRRFRYPFTNCMHCGPRYTIIRDLPYDRPSTTMAAFEMCRACRTEYENPLDRRFHAQPIACPVCGPQLQFRDTFGQETGTPEALALAAGALRAGAILALKGIGGYHLACRADDPAAVARLRRRKGRERKPLAVMAVNLASARLLAHLSARHEAALRGSAAPIVLALPRRSSGLARGIAPGCPEIGIFLPYSPLHHLLLAEVGAPLVMTSGNRSAEPLIYDDDDAAERLGAMADVLLTHNREIVRPVDDSVVMIFREREIVVRRGRGYAPQSTPFRASECDGDTAPGRDSRRTILAVGGELKSAVCVVRGDEAVLGEHLGDLEAPATVRRFESAIDDMSRLLRAPLVHVAHDMHPAYASSRYARGVGDRHTAVQHHHAHLAALLAEHGEAGPIVGVVCDGTGLGSDGAIWGGEVLWTDGPSFRRLAHLAYFPLLGGDAAAIETWRPAAGLIHTVLGPGWPERLAGDAPLLAERLARASGIGLPQLAGVLRNGRTLPCSSAGRLFDAVAFILDACLRNEFEGQAALAVQELAANCPPNELPPESSAQRVPNETVIRQRHDNPTLLHAASILRPLIQGVAAGRSAAVLAAEFHQRLARLLVDGLQAACVRSGVETVGVSGGCFANGLLLTHVVAGLERCGLRVLLPGCVPPGDGGLALGQAYVAWRRMRGE